jgi:hypothetical protein
VTVSSWIVSPRRRLPTPPVGRLFHLLACPRSRWVCPNGSSLGLAVGEIGNRPAAGSPSDSVSGDAPDLQWEPLNCRASASLIGVRLAHQFSCSWPHSRQIPAPHERSCGFSRQLEPHSGERSPSPALLCFLQSLLLFGGVGAYGLRLKPHLRYFGRGCHFSRQPEPRSGELETLDHKIALNLTPMSASLAAESDVAAATIWHPNSPDTLSKLEPFGLARCVKTGAGRLRLDGLALWKLSVSERVFEDR